MNRELSDRCLFPLVLALALLAPLSAAPARADVPQPQEVGGAIDPATFDIPAIQKSYRKILARWAGGGRSEAVAALKTLEAGVIGLDGKGRERLWKAETQAIRELEEAQHEILLPVMVLHQESYNVYREVHNPYLSLHARNLTKNLAEIYVARSPTEGAKIAAARVLTSLGSAIQEAALTELAAELYARSLDLDPVNEVALLGLGALFEKSGKYPPAIGYLSRLAKAHPAQAEGKLRLALALERSGGKPAEVRRLLEELVAGDTPGWVKNLAYEELATFFCDKGSYPKAEEILRLGLARFPNDPRLYILLSSVLERRGQSGAALKMAEKVTSLKLSSEESPRFRYSRWAPDALYALRKSLRETSDARLALLQQALATVREG